MAAGGALVKKRRKGSAAGRSGAKAFDGLAADASATSAPSWGVANARGVGLRDGDEELNPGMLLADLVREGDGPAAGTGDASAPASRGVTAKSRSSAAGGKRRKLAGTKARRRASATAAEEADVEDTLLGGMMSSDDDGEGGDGDKLISAINNLGDGQAEAGSADAAASAARRRALQAGAESEFHAGAVGEEVTVEDLIAPLTEAPTFGDVRKQLEGLARHEKLPEPVSEPKRNREDRAVQYEATKKDQRKWMPQIQRMRRADQVVLHDVKPTELPDRRIGAIISAFKPTDDFEKELEEITRAAGTTEQDMKGADALPVNERIRDEQQLRQIARLKALMLREQQMSKRVNKIKSKTYRRIHRKAESKEREVLLERLEHENPELAAQLKQEYEKKRANLRLMRQRNARRKWATTMQRFAKGDKTAQREISQQAQKAHDEQMSLRRAIQGKDPDQSEDSDAVDLSASDSEDQGAGGKRKTLAKKTIDKATKLTMQELKGLEQGGDLPTTGVLGMKFMQEAIKRKREEARSQAKSVLQELAGLEKDLDAGESAGADSDDEEARKGKADGGEKKGKPREFTEEEMAAARKQVDAMWDRPDDGMECSVSGPLTVKGVPAAATSGGSSGSRPLAGGRGKKKGAAGGAGARSAPAAAAQAAAPANPWLDLPAGDEAVAPDSAGEAAGVEAAFRAAAASLPAEASASAGSGADGRGKAGKGRKRKKSEAKQSRFEYKDDDDDGSGEDVLNALNGDSVEAQEQRNLVRTAFVEGTQLEDFDNEQEELRRKREEDEDASLQPLAGWGSWTGAGVKPRRPKGKGKGGGKGGGEAGEAQVVNRPRLPRVQTLEGKPTEAAKYFVDKLPFPYTNPKQYEQGMAMPTGPEWNALPAFKNKIKPKIFVKIGAIVPPLEHVKHLPKEQRDGALKMWASAKQPKRLKARI